MKNKNTNRRGDASRLRFLLILATTAVLVFTGARIQAAPGDLDGSFGNGGIVTTDVDAMSSRDLSYEVLIEPDGKMVAVGTCDSATHARICLARYNPDGNLDLAFGTNGKVITEVGAFWGNAGARQTDGKILVAGLCFQQGTGTYADFCVTRYSPDGSLDTTFGGGGTVTVGGYSSDGINAIVIQGDGKIVAAGKCYISHNSTPDFCLARFNSNGDLDTTFGGTGLIATNIGAYYDEAYAVAIQGDGKIVAAGACQAAWDDNGFSRSTLIFCLARYNADGSLDTSFDGDGIVAAVDNVAPYSYDWVSAIALQRDGKIVAVGAGSLARYNPDGSLDTTFSGDGIVSVGDVAVHPGGSAIAIQQNGKIITVSGHRSNIFSWSRFNPDGSPDTTIGYFNHGTVDTLVGEVEFLRHGDNAGPYAVAIQRDGKIVLAGAVGVPSAADPTVTGRFDFALVRYFGDPTNRSPVCGNVAADISVLATPNHTLQLITLSGATDPDGDALTLTITGVTQDEPVNGQGDGDTSPDAASGPMSNQVYIRGERSGKGDGRVYRIAFTVSDDKGGTCSGTGIGDGNVNVSVPRNQSGVAAVDSGEAFNSFGP